MSNNPFQSPTSSDNANIAGNEYALDRAVKMLRQTKPWVRIISVLCFAGGGLLMVLGVFIMLRSAAYQEDLGDLGVVMGLTYFVLAMFYVAPAWLLWQYGIRIRVCEREPTIESLTSALEAQKSFWMFAGIVTLLFLLLYVLVIVYGFSATTMLSLFGSI